MARASGPGQKFPFRLRMSGKPAAKPMKRSMRPPGRKARKTQPPKFGGPSVR